MSYIWQNYSATKDFYIEERPLSPYLEVGNETENKIGVNPVPRFYKIFAPFFKTDFEEKNFDALENILFHYLAQLDLKSGKHLTSFLESELDKEIREDVFGIEARKIYLSLSENERRIFLIYLQRHESAQGLKNFFFQAVAQFFLGSKFYFYEPEKKFLICLPYFETEHRKNLLDLLVFFLFDMGAAYEFFWNCHFGVIGEDETMHLDELVIY